MVDTKEPSGWFLLRPVSLSCRRCLLLAPLRGLSSVSRGELKKRGNSLMVQWLGLHAFTAGGRGLIPG